MNERYKKTVRAVEHFQECCKDVVYALRKKKGIAKLYRLQRRGLAAHIQTRRGRTSMNEASVKRTGRRIYKK